jgi:hypothetical protein
MELSFGWVTWKSGHLDHNDTLVRQLSDEKLFKLRIEPGSRPQQNDELTVNPNLIALSCRAKNPCCGDHSLSIRRDL